MLVFLSWWLCSGFTQTDMPVRFLHNNRSILHKFLFNFLFLLSMVWSSELAYFALHFMVIMVLGKNIFCWTRIDITITWSGYSTLDNIPCNSIIFIWLSNFITYSVLAKYCPIWWLKIFFWPLTVMGKSWSQLNSWVTLYALKSKLIQYLLSSDPPLM